MVTRDARIDAYIEKAPEFARPVLTALRAAIHAACPDVVETIKWRLDQAMEWIAAGKPRNWKYMKC